MKRTPSCLLFVLLSFFANEIYAQSVADLWISMPEDIVPYLNVNQRKEMIECHKIGVDNSVRNKFDGKTSIDTLTVDYGKFHLSNSRLLEIAKLPCVSDTIIMVIDTYKAPEEQCKVSFYDETWNQLSIEGKLPEITVEDLLHKPDTMAMQVYEDLRKLVLTDFVAYKYDFNNKILEICLSLPLVTSKEKEQLNSIIRKRKLKWGDVCFN